MEKKEKFKAENEYQSYSCIVCVFTRTIATYCTANNTVTSLSAREKKEISIECIDLS